MEELGLSNKDADGRLKEGADVSVRTLILRKGTH